MEKQVAALKATFVKVAKAMAELEGVAPHAELEDIRSSLSVLASRLEVHLDLPTGDLNKFKEP